MPLSRPCSAPLCCCAEQYENMRKPTMSGPSVVVSNSWTAEQFDNISPAQVEQQELTTITHVEDDEVAVETQRNPEFDPYPDKTPTHLLSRRYLVDDFTLNDLSVRSIWPFALLAEMPGPAHCFKGFGYFRGDVHLTVMLTTTRTVFGTLLVSSVPMQDPSVPPASQPYMSVTQRVQAQSHFLDLSTQNMLEMHLPFLHPNRMWTIGQIDEARQWRVDFSLLDLGFTSSEATQGVKVSVWANFVNPKLAGYMDGQFQSMVRHRPGGWLAPTMAAAGALVSAGTSAIASYLGGGAAQNVAVGAAAAGISLNNLADAVTKGSNLYRALAKRSEVQPTKPCMTPDLNGTGSTALPFLGDPVRGPKLDKPDVRNMSDIAAICATPAYWGLEILRGPEDSFEVPCDAALDYSYFKFFKRCFKYVRYDTLVTIRVSTSQDIRGKLLVTLLPVPGNSSTTLGELPTQVMSIAGTTDYSFVVPYLEPTHWLENYEIPSSRVKFSLLGQLPQPYDVPSQLNVHIFLSPVNLRFGSLQSPCNNAELQATIWDIAGVPECVGTSFFSESMGGYRTVYDMLQRYSSRDPSVDNLFPFPRRLNAELYQYDLYDYVSQLYCFYTGSVDIKYCFTNAPSNGLLKMVVGNSNADSVHGNKLKAGNSMVLTSQSVWPMVEFNYPFERKVDFDSLDEPSPHYIPEISNIESLSEILVRPGPDFAYFTLMPTPDWSDDYAVFQSTVARVSGLTNWAQAGVTVTSASTYSTTLTGYPDAVAHVVRITANGLRTDGNVDFGFCGGVMTSSAVDSNAQNILTNSLLPVIGRATDHSNSGRLSFSCTSHKVLANINGPFKFSARLTAASSVDALVTFVIEVFPFLNTVIPLTPDYAFAAAVPALPSTVPVSLAQTANVAVVNSPTVSLASPIQIDSSTPVNVSVQEPVEVEGSVSITGPVTLAGEVPVYGSLNERPVFVTNYKN